MLCHFGSKVGPPPQPAILNIYRGLPGSGGPFVFGYNCGTQEFQLCPGKGSRRERQIYEKAPHTDYVSARMANDRCARAASADSRACRTRRHAAPDAPPDTARRFARAESIQFLALQGMVCRSRKESASAGRLFRSRAGRYLRSGAKGSLGLGPLVHGRSEGLYRPAPAHGSVSPSLAGGHQHAEPGEISLCARERRSQSNHSVPGCRACGAAGEVPFVCSETHELGEELVGSYLYQVHLYHWLESNDHGRFLSDNDI